MGRAAALTEAEAKTGSGIDYVSEMILPLYGYEVSSSDTELKEVPSLTDILDGEDVHKIYVRREGTADTVPGDFVPVPLTSRPAAPENLVPVKATDITTKDGGIEGTNATMEYKPKESTDGWTTVSVDSITGLMAGTYLVRVKAVPAGDDTEAANLFVNNSGVWQTVKEKKMNISRPIIL